MESSSPSAQIDIRWHRHWQVLIAAAAVEQMEGMAGLLPPLLLSEDKVVAGALAAWHRRQKEKINASTTLEFSVRIEKSVTSDRLNYQ